MPFKPRIVYFIALLLLPALILTACGSDSPVVDQPNTPAEGTSISGGGGSSPEDSPSLGATATPAASQTPTPLPPPPRLLTICLGREPRSLFYYEARSLAAQAVLAAIYDGPFEIRDFTPYPVIVEKIPALADGDALIQSVDVQPGDLIVDSNGNLVNLEQGTSYRPAGCTQQSCVQAYAGDQPIQLDQLNLRFRLKPGLAWSDGVSLTAGDSVYSYEVARALFPAVEADLVGRTQFYQALDETTVEWVGVPGYIDAGVYRKFFTPLPQHAWGMLPPEELATSDLASRMPLGWGAYKIEEWISGDHITLAKNPYYWRAAEGLPHFDYLVYRFVANGDEALEALLAGECDLVDQTAMLESQSSRLLELQAEGKLKAIFETSTAWELLAFGIESADAERPNYFGSQAVRQAVAHCIDRQALVEDLTGGLAQVARAYVPPAHPLFAQGTADYPFDPARGNELLETAGWRDLDGDPITPRQAQGVPGVFDGTALEVELLTSNEPERQAAAEMIKEMLAQCGLAVRIVEQETQTYLAPGPEGPVFGRDFDLAQYAWVTAQEPPCSLYLTNEIPGAYPQASKGWGGVNAAGYSNPAYDAACQNALYALPDWPQHREAHQQAQAIFAEDLPSLPLYWRFKVVATRPDLCGVSFEPSSSSALTYLEDFDDAEGCLE